jgi:hypothetical protein
MTMTDPQIVCPTCQTQIRLTEQLAAPLIAETQRKFEQQLAARESEFGRREATLRQAQDELAKARASVEDEVAARLQAERQQIKEAEAVRARTAMMSSKWKLKNAFRLTVGAAGFGWGGE